MNALFKDFRDALGSLLPVVVLVLAVHLLTGVLTPELCLRWVIGGVFATVGLFFFLRGVEYCLTPLGDLLGTRFPLAPNLFLLILPALLIGAAANVADPSVSVLAGHVDAVSSGNAPPTWMVIASVVGGVGIFLALAMLRILLNLPFRPTLGIAYGIAICTAFFVPQEYVALALDSGGVATGPLTVPFLLAIGMGFVSVLHGRDPSSDGFGVLGLVALGPIFGVMLLGAAW